MTSSSLPDHPFWNFSLRLYTQTRVAAACLALQDACRLNVNLLLYCCWMGKQGYLLAPQDLERQIQAVEHWQSEVVMPLRAIRRRMKSAIVGFSMQRSEPLRQAIQQVEIEAERLEQLRLAEFSAQTKAATAGVAVTVRNLETYLGVCNVSRSKEIDARLQVLADACHRQTC